MNDDATLLRRYAEEGSEAAFTELVRRHLDLVYGTALRRTGGDEHRAADATQQVFISLARHARKLAQHPVLSAWLHTATRNAALKLVISDQRRQTREAAAFALNPPEAPAPDWAQLRPLLDGAIDTLPEDDRAAVVLRFLERRAFADIGAALRVSEDAARMRVERALDKLRAALARRDVKSTGAALATLLANQAGATAPAVLAGAIATTVLAGVAGSGIGAVNAGIFMSKTTAVMSVVAGAALGAAFYQWNLAVRAGSESASLVAERDGLRGQLATERLRARQATAETAALRADITLSKTKSGTRPPNAVADLSDSGAARRAEVVAAIRSNLRQIASARDQATLENGRAPGSIDDLVGPEKYIKRLLVVSGESYASLPMAPGQSLAVTTPDGMTVSYDPASARTERSVYLPQVSAETGARVDALGQKIGPSLRKAVAAYKAANDNRTPANQEAYLAFFDTPQEGADFVEFLEAQKAARDEINRIVRGK